MEQDRQWRSRKSAAWTVMLVAVSRWSWTLCSTRTEDTLVYWNWGHFGLLELRTLWSTGTEDTLFYWNWGHYVLLELRPLCSTGSEATMFYWSLFLLPVVGRLRNWRLEQETTVGRVYREYGTDCTLKCTFCTFCTVCTADTVQCRETCVEGFEAKLFTFTEDFDV